MPLSEHIYYVNIAFKMTEWVEQRMCIKFCINILHEHSSMETIQMIQKAMSMGNWWLAASSWQHAHSCITCCAVFLVKYPITQVTEVPYSPDVVPCNFWLFPKLKPPLKGKRFQIFDEIQEDTTGQLIETGRAVWGPKVPTFKGIEVTLSYVQCFLYLVSSIYVSIFHWTWLDTFWTNLIYCYSMLVNSKTGSLWQTHLPLPNTDVPFHNFQPHLKIGGTI